MSLFSRALQITVNSGRNHWKKAFTDTRCAFSVNHALQYARVQQPAPDFKGTAAFKDDFKEIKLADYRGRYLVFFFYPLDFSFVCPTELIAFNERHDDFKAIQTDILACSTDSHYSHLAWMKTPKKAGGVGELKYPLLSDFTKTISRSYDVLIESTGVALRGLFIIDAEGIIRQITVNDLPVGRSIEEVLRLVKALQFHDKHGEVCPANWEPTKDTIKPNPKEAKEYFEKVNK